MDAGRGCLSLRPFPAPLDGKPRPRCYLDVGIGGEPLPKRIVVELAVRRGVGGDGRLNHVASMSSLS